MRCAAAYLQARSAVFSGLVLISLMSLAGGSSTPGALAAEPELLFESETLRIYRVVDAGGVARLVLTNLDEEGELLAPDTGEVVAPRSRTAERVEEIAETVVEERPPNPSPATRAEFEGSAGGTTIIININNPPPAPAPATVPVLVAPVFAVGGLRGPFRYPERQPFLGYGTGIGSPALFSGLGLNAGNRYGLKTGKTCDRGFDCLFPPTSDNP